jgi:hypothetical protein
MEKPRDKRKKYASVMKAYLPPPFGKEGATIKKMGRPTDDPKRNQHKVRLSDNELEMLDYCCKITGLTKADVIRRGIKTVFEEVQGKKE